jgi:transposase
MEAAVERWPVRLVELSAAERGELEGAARREKRVRQWRRYQALLLLGAGEHPTKAAAAVGCSLASIYNWASAWNRPTDRRGRPLARKLDTVGEAPHGGRPRRLDSAAEAEVGRLLAADPQARGYAATDWTVPLLRTQLGRQGHALSARTLRRALHRLGYRWKRPKYVLGRPDPAYEQKRGRWSSR